MLYELKKSLASYKKKRKPHRANTLFVSPKEKELFSQAAGQLRLEMKEDKTLQPRYYVLDCVG